METLSISVTDAGTAINPIQLAEFLFLFRGVNVAVSRVVPRSNQHALRRPTQTEVDKCRRSLAAFSPKQIDSCFDPHKAADLLEINRITLESPLEIVLVGSSMLLVLAVILSGGRIEVGPTSVKAALPPLGKGIKSLLDAFGIKNPLKVGYGIREITIKLSKTEFAELMAPVSGSGGFQNFFRALQYRINKQTRKLTLSEADLDFIYRHKCQPEKGGWQAKLQKIFARHLPDERK